MKTSKKVLAIVLAVALVLALSVTAFAKTVSAGDGPASITVHIPEITDDSRRHRHQLYAG